MELVELVVAGLTLASSAAGLVVGLGNRRRLRKLELEADPPPAATPATRPTLHAGD